MISQQHKNVIESTKFYDGNGSNFNPKKMEAALNDWLVKVEDQVNQIEDSLEAKASLQEMQHVEQRF